MGLEALACNLWHDKESNCARNSRKSLQFYSKGEFSTWERSDETLLFVPRS